MLECTSSPASPPCIWVEAGLLNYRLCDRNLDCEHCPLDAALRAGRTPRDADAGHSIPVLPATAPPAIDFPADRRYARDHTWLQEIERSGRRRVLRLGLDGFAASVLPPPRAVSWTGVSGRRQRGERLCRLEFDEASLLIGCPIDARLRRCNPRLAGNPAALVTAPYGAGWIAELEADGAQMLAGLRGGEAARAQARQDARRLRRRLALQLLADDGAEDRPPGPDRQLLEDLRQTVGDARYLSLVHEVLP